MSWAADNPEKYDEICRNGIVAKLQSVTRDWSGVTVDALTLDDVVGALQEEGGKVYDALLTWANKQVCDAEADHFGSMVDDAYERGR